MIFDNKGNKLAISKTDLERIYSVFIGERKFVVLNNKFVELIHDSKWDLYVEHKSDLKERGKDAGLGGTSQTSAISTYSAAHLRGSIYNLTLPDDFEVESYFLYWLEKKGKLKQFANMNQLKKSYKDKKNVFNDHVKKHNVKYEDSESIIELLKVLESN
ncbi:hypothetical protein PZB74_12460 [Porifericola rhodea]|uniref:hypothetical protein n=1 Tax=Porifericola rhodea TaxID=930972 RepID=UPI0026652202|nr:hypothetical protein [Porifericola rhodea]WKN29779.1 hypothetical protein PZB74_12460 [Porifericola rhodea]